MAFFLRRCALLSLLSLFCSLSFAQNRTTPVAASDMVRLLDMEWEEVDAPQYDANARILPLNRGARLDWLQIQAEYATALDWTDEITFTFYVALNGDPENLPEGSSPRNVFSGSVTFINLPKGRDHKVDMFLDPYTFERFGDVFAVAVEVEVNGEAAGILTEPQELAVHRWWESQTPNYIPLLPRHESPFRLVEVEQQATTQP